MLLERICLMVIHNGKFLLQQLKYVGRRRKSSGKTGNLKVRYLRNKHNSPCPPPPPNTLAGMLGLPRQKQ